MKIATWNVNSIRSRLDRLVAWLQKMQPDVLCVQELKATDEAFPYDPIRALGYHATVFGQKAYNGVAILSRSEPDNVRRGMTGFDDPEARFLCGEICGITVASVYVPNGQSVGSEKYLYKLRWLDRLREHVRQHLRPSAPLLLCGDFNVARDELDVARPDAWAGSVVCDEGSRKALADLLDGGFVDVFRRRHPEGGLYSWWDYRRLAFPKNDGLRLDYVLATEPLAQRCIAAAIDRDQRKGTLPSDHAPVIVEFEM